MTLRVVCSPVTDLSQRFIFPYPAGDMVIGIDECSSSDTHVLFIQHSFNLNCNPGFKQKDSAERGSGLPVLHCPFSTKLGFADVFLRTDIPAPTVLPQN